MEAKWSCKHNNVKNNMLGNNNMKDGRQWSESCDYCLGGKMKNTLVTTKKIKIDV